VSARTRTPSAPKGVGPVAEEPQEDEDGLGKLALCSRDYPFLAYRPDIFGDMSL